MSDALSKKYYLITRPLEDSLKLSKKLESLGHYSFCEPLLNIEFFDDVAVDANEYEAIIFTSANGIKALKRYDNFADFLNLRAYCVGESSGKLAIKLGFNKVNIASGDVDKLTKLVIECEEGSKQITNKFLHISGYDAAGDLKNKLDGSNITIDRVILYKANKTANFSEELIDLLISKKVKGVLLFSPRTTKIFCDLIAKYKLENEALSLDIFCLSQNVAYECETFNFNNIKIAKTPSTKNLLELITKQ